MKKMIVNMGKMSIAIQVEQDMTLKEICARLDNGDIPVLAYKHNTGVDRERYWRYPSSEKMGKAAVVFNSPVVLRKEIESDGIRNIWVNKSHGWIARATGTPLKQPIEKHIKEKKNSGPIKEAHQYKKQKGAQVTVTFTGTAEEIMHSMRKMLNL